MPDEVYAAPSDDTRSDALAAEFAHVAGLNWQTQFSDAGTDDWRANWFLDGEKATVENTPDGMVLTAGMVPGENESHTVLWTMPSFTGDVRIDFDFTRLDEADRFVNILYIQATGRGEVPYVEDIHAWRDLRKVSSMSAYYYYMNTLHVSFAAFGNDPGGDVSDYIRARRYPVAPGSSFREFAEQTALTPEYADTGLFETGVTYHVTCIKRGARLFFSVNDGKQTHVHAFDLAGAEPVHEGRIGLRQMCTRQARYANFRVSTLGESE